MPFASRNVEDSSPPYRRSAKEILATFFTDPAKGLTAEQVRSNLARYGPNQLIGETPVPAWRKFLRQFEDVLTILLLIATVVSAIVWGYEPGSSLPYEAIAIVAIVLLNAAMGYVQTARAEQALESLRAMSPPESAVIRDGQRSVVLASEIVPGDLLLIEEGDRIPADARLIEATWLRTSEAALTGESAPVSKDAAPILVETQVSDRRNMVFSGTVVVHGRGTAVVVATGMETEIGRIAKLLKETPSESTPLQKQLNRTGKLLGLIVIAIAIVITATIILTEHVSKFSALVDVFIFSIALGVAAVPEGLPTIVTVVLSSGIKRMAQRNVLIRRLAAVETLGSANVITSDKTGTLTKNEMTVRRIITASGATSISSRDYAREGDLCDESGEELSEAVRFELEQTLIIAVCANNAVLKKNNGDWLVQGDPTEAALLLAARKTGLDIPSLESRLKRAGEVPFSSERKRMTAVCRELGGEERLFVFSKGAPDVLLKHCSYQLVGRIIAPLTEGRRTEIVRATEELAGQALRTLAMAYQEFPREAKGILPASQDVEQELVFAGLVGMMDPPREEARAAVDLTKGAGIRVIMITGDHRRTAEVIAKELGIGNGRAITGLDLDTVSDEELPQLAGSTSVYARVNPEHKLRIVKALQRDGAIVAMTGDGVNDAPALKAADIGIAMGRTGTDVSKEVADMVLADDNFVSIVAAVEEGRAIFFNIRKFLRFLLSSNIGEVMTMFFGVVLAKFIGLRSTQEALTLPLVATQILWINLVTDGAPALALGLDPADDGVMSLPPRPKTENVINRQMWVGIGFVGAVMAASTLLVLDASLPGGLINGTGGIRYAQTMAFTTLVLAQICNVFNARSDEQSALVGLFRNHWLWLAVLLSCSLQVLVVYVPSMQQAFRTVPLSLTDWLLCAGVASSVLWLRELAKLLRRRFSG